MTKPMQKTPEADWESRFDKEFPEGSFVTHAIHTSYGGEKEPLENKRRSKVKQFISKVIAKARKEEREKVVQDACKITDVIESQMETTLDEWKMFKRIRNAMRDQLLSKEDL